MLKTTLLVVAGLVTGLAIAFWLQPSPEPSAEAEAVNRAASVARSDTNAGLAERTVWRVDLQPSDEKKNLFINSSGPIVVQLMDDDGKTVQAIPIAPIQ